MNLIYKKMQYYTVTWRLDKKAKPGIPGFAFYPKVTVRGLHKSFVSHLVSSFMPKSRCDEAFF